MVCPAAPASYWHIYRPASLNNCRQWYWDDVLPVQCHGHHVRAYVHGPGHRETRPRFLHGCRKSSAAVCVRVPMAAYAEMCVVLYTQVFVRAHAGVYAVLHVEAFFGVAMVWQWAVCQSGSLSVGQSVSWAVCQLDSLSVGQSVSWASLRFRLSSAQKPGNTPHCAYFAYFAIVCAKTDLPTTGLYDAVHGSRCVAMCASLCCVS